MIEVNVAFDAHENHQSIEYQASPSSECRFSKQEETTNRITLDKEIRTRTIVFQLDFISSVYQICVPMCVSKQHHVCLVFDRM